MIPPKFRLNKDAIAAVFMLALTLLFFVPVIGGLLIVNPFHNRVLSAITAIFWTYLLCFFFFGFWHAQKIASFTAVVQSVMKWQRNRRPLQYPVVIWKWTVDLKAIWLKAVGGMVRTALLCSVIVISLASALWAAVFFEQHFYEENYQGVCVEVYQQYEQASVKLLEEKISSDFDDKLVWDGESLRSCLTDSLSGSGELAYLYNCSAAKRAAPLIQIAQLYRKIDEPDKLTEIDPNTYIDLVTRNYSDAKKEALLEALFALIEECNSKNYQEYQEIYAQYSELADQFGEITRSAGAKEREELQKFNLDHMLAIKKEIEELRSRIIASEDVQEVRNHYSVPDGETRIMKAHSDSCIARLEVYHEYQNGNEKEGLRYSRRRIIYDCEDTFMALYDQLGALHEAVDNLIWAAFGELDVLSLEEMSQLVRYGHLERDETGGEAVDCASLEKMQRQLIGNLNLSLSENDEQSQMLIEALDSCVSLYRLKDEIGQYQEKKYLIYVTDYGKRLRMEQLRCLFQKAGLSEYCSDIELIERYFWGNEPGEHLYFIFFSPALRVMDADPSFEDLRTGILSCTVFVAMVYIAMVVINAVRLEIGDRNKKKTRKKRNRRKRRTTA